MKSLSAFFVITLALASVNAGAAPVATTLGSNLTAYNGGSGATNNNNWNNLMNSRSGGTAPTADFGNCNALILRCAQPKCATGGCTTMDVAMPIVSGCVQSNESCKQYGDDLIQYISAQLVASSTAKANAQAAAAQTAAAQAAAQQSAQQLQQMQAQMQQMQSQMAQQNAETVAQLQSALEEQKQLTAQAIADANTAAQASAAATQAASAAVDSGLSDSQASAAASGVSADVLAREQISGQIMSKLENAQTALKTLEATMNTTFEYAGCDTSGNNCAGPKRVKAFKQRAMQFFDPYNDVLDELYDALIMAQSLGVDITDIYMMLNGTCNAWAQYLCGPGQVMHYTSQNCGDDGRSIRTSQGIRGGAPCQVGQVVPMSDGGCQLVKMLTSDEEVQRNWLYPEEGTEKGVEVRVGCASEALENSTLFRNRKKQAAIDIDTLQRIIEQDAPAIYGSNRLSSAIKPIPDGVKFCAVNAESLQELQKSVSLKQLPKKVCVDDADLKRTWENNGVVTVVTAATGNTSGSSSTSTEGGLAILDCDSNLWKNSNECKCRNSGGTWWGKCSCPAMYTLVDDRCEFDVSGKLRETQQLLGYMPDVTSSFSVNTDSVTMSMCSVYGGKWDFEQNRCNCVGARDFENCMKL